MHSSWSGQADVVVIGGGVVGSSVALHVCERAPGARVVVIERDPTYARASSRLATGGVRQQYGSLLNVQMAQHSIAFYRGFDARVEAAGCTARARFRQRGYLFLADAAGAAALEQRCALQRECGARVEQWSTAQVRANVPGLRSDDIALAMFGPDDGYLEPREVLRGIVALAEHAGAVYIHGEVVGTELTGRRMTGVHVSTAGGVKEISASTIVNAAGPFAGRVAECAGLALPIDPVRQHLFRLELARPLPSRIPMIFDPDGTHWRLDDDEGSTTDRIVIGRSRSDEPVGENFACDPGRLDDEMLPVFARRHPNARVVRTSEAWAGLYEMTPDHNGLLGEHPARPGFVVAAGFSGHGLMLAPATGCAVAELVVDGACSTFDIGPLAPDRFDRGVYFHDGALI